MTTKTKELDRAIDAIVMAVDFELRAVLPAEPGPMVITVADEEGSRIAEETGDGNPLGIFDTQENDRATEVTEDVITAVREGRDIRHIWDAIDDAITTRCGQSQLIGLIVGYAGGLRAAGISRSRTKEQLKIFLHNFAAQEDVDAEAPGATAAH